MRSPFITATLFWPEQMLSHFLLFCLQSSVKGVHFKITLNTSRGSLYHGLHFLFSFMSSWIVSTSPSLLRRHYPWRF